MKNPTPEFVEAARHVLHHSGDPRGYEGGTFTARLLDAWAHADLENRARLAAAFPALSIAVAIVSSQGVDALADAAGIDQ